MSCCKHLASALSVLVFATMAMNAAADDLEVTQRRQPLYVNKNLLLPSVVPVCWETSGFNLEKRWVRNAIQRTWESACGIQFVGWGNCMRDSEGSRIKIEDDTPHTCGLGMKIWGEEGGMVLNFTFRKWNRDCQAPPPNRQRCIESIAVHEFGHAMGFAHEQNRPDTPPCPHEPQGSDGNYLVGAWDLNSVMNYCNRQWNNGGVLSPTDIIGAQKCYGLPDSGWWGGVLRDWCVQYWGSRPLLVGDFNGDKLTDMICHTPDNGTVEIIYATGFENAPFIAGGNYWSGLNGWCLKPNYLQCVGDFNGDGRDDLLCHSTVDGRKWLCLADRNGNFSDINWTSDMKWCFGPSRKLKIGDFNGDGRDDLLCHDVNDGRRWISFAHVNGTFSSTSWSSSTKFCPNGNVHIGDFNGDGRDDLLCHSCLDAEMSVALADSNGEFSSTITSWPKEIRFCCWSDDGEVKIGDINGDGRDDVVCHDWKTGWKSFVYATPNGSFRQVDFDGPYAKWCMTPAGYHFGKLHFLLGEFNGDRTTDFLCHDPGTGYVRINFLPQSPASAAPTPPSARSITSDPDFQWEDNMDLPGMDSNHFWLDRADPKLCRNACAADANCKAFTYVKPGVQGSKAKCWLKRAVPACRPSDCCVSGVRISTGPPHKVRAKAPPADSFPDSYCKQYADTALRQIHYSMEMGLKTSSEDPMWRYDFRYHYDWCVGASREESEAQTKSRQKFLDDNSAAAPPSGGGTWGISKENFCNDYANKTIEQVTKRIKLEGSPPSNDPKWSTDWRLHYNWCMAGATRDQCEAIMQERQRWLTSHLLKLPPGTQQHTVSPESAKHPERRLRNMPKSVSQPPER